MLDREELVHEAARRSAAIMVAKVEGLRAVLRDAPPAALALRSGAAFVQRAPEPACLELAYLFTDYVVTCPDFEVLKAGDGQPASPFTQAVVLSYLQAADGTPRAHEWVSLRELPDGQFYHRAFQGYTGDMLAARLGNDLEAFRRGAVPLADVALTAFGDAAYAFRVFPNLYMAVIYWLGDEDFPPRASVLFDKAAAHYLSLDGLAVVGSQLTGKILRGALASG
ncbi:MAG: hypothetical protein Kow00120_07820 [Anaerolineae bacterium]